MTRLEIFYATAGLCIGYCLGAWTVYRMAKRRMSELARFSAAQNSYLADQLIHYMRGTGPSPKKRP